MGVVNYPRPLPPLLLPPPPDRVAPPLERIELPLERTPPLDLGALRGVDILRLVRVFELLLIFRVFELLFMFRVFWFCLTLLFRLLVLTRLLRIVPELLFLIVLERESLTVELFRPVFVLARTLLRFTLLPDSERL